MEDRLKRYEVGLEKQDELDRQETLRREQELPSMHEAMAELYELEKQQREILRQQQRELEASQRKLKKEMAQEAEDAEMEILSAQAKVWMALADDNLDDRQRGEYLYRERVLQEAQGAVEKLADGLRKPLRTEEATVKEALGHKKNVQGLLENLDKQLQDYRPELGKWELKREKALRLQREAAEMSWGEAAKATVGQLGVVLGEGLAVAGKAAEVAVGNFKPATILEEGLAVAGKAAETKLRNLWGRGWDWLRNLW